MKNNLIVLSKSATFLQNLKGWYTVRITTSCLAVVNSLLVALIIQKVTDSALLQEGKGYESLVVLFVGTLISSVLTNYFMNLSGGKLHAEIGINIHRKLSLHLQQISTEDKEKWGAGEYITRFTSDADAIRGYLANTAPQVTFLFFMLVGVSGYLAFLNWVLFLFAATTISLLAFMSIKLGKPLSQFNERLNKINDGINNASIEAVEGTQLSKLYNLNRFLIRNYYLKLRAGLAEQENIIRKQSFLNGFNHLLYFIPTMGGVVLGGILSMQGKISPGQVISFIYVMHFFAINTIEGLLGQVGIFRSVISSITRVVELMERPSEYWKRNIATIGQSKSKTPSLTMENVTYTVNQRAILREINLSLEINKKTALVGPSGSGKTTIANMICGFITSYRGSIKLFGNDLKEYDPETARNFIAVVAQDNYVFPGSIYDNIRYGQPDASDEEIYHAARLSHAHEFIEKLPDKYETVVGERGANLSGGQIQRLAIARAFLKNAPILILDEPTSSLDSASQAYVHKAMDHLMKDKAVLVITHELSAARAADEILVMKDGQIVERGNHVQLINSESTYRELYNASFGQ